MAYVSSTRGKHPLDLNKNVKIGVAFPLDQINLNKGTDSIREQLKSNLISVLLTEPGERVYQPDFGVGLKKLLFENSVNTRRLNRIIDKQIKLYVPQIQLINTLTDYIQQENLLYIKIIYKYRLDGSQDSIQLNFNRTN